jgi:hypothetical protein
VKLTRTRFLLVALAAPIAMIAATTAPASAASAATAVVTGTGTIDPPLDLNPVGHTFDFSGNALTTGVLCGTTHAAENLSASASGTDIAGTILEGAGLLSVTIDGCTGSGAYVRVGATVVVALALPAVTAATGVCAFVPNPLTPPVGAYSVTCGSLIVQAP